jgi:hypothetical protein
VLLVGEGEWVDWLMNPKKQIIISINCEGEEEEIIRVGERPIDGRERGIWDGGGG